MGDYEPRRSVLKRAMPEGTLSFTCDAAGNLASMNSSNAHGVPVKICLRFLQTRKRPPSHSRRPFRIRIFWLRGLDLNQRPLGYEETKTLLNQQLKEIAHNAKPL